MRYIFIEHLENRTLFSAALNWQTVAPMPIPRAEGASFVADGKFYCFGGFDNATTLAISNEMDAYDPVTNTWTRMADCPVKVNDNPVTVDPVTDTAWCGGFFLNDGYHASGLMYEYHIQTNTWSQGPSLPMNVGAGQMGVVGRALFYFGGRNAANVGSVLTWKLNLDNTSAGWVADTPMPFTANHDGAVVLNNKIYAIGGIVNKEETTSNENHVQVFDPSTDQWTLAAPMPIGLGHIASAVTVADGDIIVAGGQVDGAGQVMSREVLQYDPASNSWTQLTNLPSQRVSDFVGYLDGKLIITGGNMYSPPYINTTTWVANYGTSGPSLPTVSIADASAQAGNDVQFTATLSAPATAVVTASFTFTPGTATAADFNSAAGTLTFPVGATQATIDVPTFGDSTGVSEQFTVTLSGISGNATFSNSTSTESATGTITAAPPSATITTLNASANTLVIGQSDTFNVSVISTSSGLVPTGSVTILDNGTTLGMYPLSSDGTLTATLAAAVLETDASYTAVYSGDANHIASTSNAVLQTVLPASSLLPVIGNAVVPVTAVAGQPFMAHIPEVLENTDDDESEKGTVKLQVYADTTDTGLTDHAALVDTLTRKLNLKPGKHAALLFSIKSLPTTLAVDTYHLVFKLTDAAGDSSIVTSQQTVSVAAPLVTLMATVGTATPAMIKAGRGGFVSVAITNTGNVIAHGKLNVQIVATDSAGNPLGVTLASFVGSATIKPRHVARYRIRIKIPANQPAGLIYPSAVISFATVSASVTAINPITVS